MKRVILTLEEKPPVPLEADSLDPSALAKMNPGEMESVEVWCGRLKRKLGDFFRTELAEGPPDLPVGTVVPDTEVCLEFRGDLSWVKHLGQGLQEGIIIVRGDVGPYLGAEMTGGFIFVEGSAGDWTGAHMSGGCIRIGGSVGNFTGSAYWGLKKGMTGGYIVVEGSCGDMTGRLMRRGVIAVLGDAGDFTSCNMIAGTVLVGGTTGRRTGAEMKRGTVILARKPQLLPTFTQTCTCRPVFLSILARWLRGMGVTVPGVQENAICRRHAGDVVVNGKGEILVCLN